MKPVFTYLWTYHLPTPHCSLISPSQGHRYWGLPVDKTQFSEAKSQAFSAKLFPSSPLTAQWYPECHLLFGLDQQPLRSLGLLGAQCRSVLEWKLLLCTPMLEAQLQPLTSPSHTALPTATSQRPIRPHVHRAAPVSSPDEQGGAQ